MERNRMRVEMNFRWLALGVVAWTVAGLPARAGIIINVGSASVFRGGTSTLDVTLSNTGLSAQNLAGFSFEISVPVGSGITFSGVNETTGMPYIFFGDSFDTISNGDSTISHGTAHPGPGAIIDASDFSNSGLGVSVASGATLGLGHVLFSAAGGAPLGPAPVTLSTAGCPTACGPTSLSDSNGASVAFSGVNGAITVAASSVPEPSTLLLLLFTIPVLAVARRLLCCP
jgi:hypothetical protein